jgi:hypothetical protein
MDGGRVVTIPLPITPLLRTDDPYLEDITALLRKLDTENVEYDRVDRYYTGDQPLSFMAPEVVAQIGTRLAPLVINWPETIVDSVNRRVREEGFRLGRGATADDELWRIWTANELDEESSLGNADALVHGKAFLSVWSNPDDPETPSIWYESAHQVTCDYEPGGRSVRAAIKRWRVGDDTFVTLYLPDQVRKYVNRGGTKGVGRVRWELREAPIANPLGVVPIVPMVNRGRLLNREGRSELASVAPIADGINKLATDLLVTAEFFTSPRRYATGIQLPVDTADRERLQAEVAAYWDEATKKKTWLAGEGVQFGQFPEATLDGFVQGIRLLTSALAAIGGLPPEDLGLPTTNPASAEARRAAETTLILRAKEKWGPFGGARTRAMRLALAARDGISVQKLPQEYKRMAVAWADPATPAIAQAMDAAVKGVESGVYDIEACQEAVGLPPVQRAAIKARREEAAAMKATADVRARMDLARELTRTDGLTLNAAMAAVGLLAAAATNNTETTPPLRRSDQ